MRRKLLGAIAVLLVICGIVGKQLLGGSETQIDTFFDACVRSGIVLGALWLAFPKLIEISAKVPPWLLGAILLAGLVVVVRPRYIIVVVPLLAVLVIMHFLGGLLRPQRKPTRQKRRRPVRPDGRD